jgi:hypothetical protein
MAWEYMTAVQETLGDSISTAPSNKFNTNINQLQVGAIRRIWQPNEHNAAKAHAQMFQANGKFTIATLGDHDTPLMTTAAWTAAVTAWVNAMAEDNGGPCSMVELINEPFAKYWRPGGSHFPMFWDRIREAAPIIHAAGMELVLGGPPTGDYVEFLNRAKDQGDIFGRIDGLGVHPYFTTPGTSLSTGMLKWVKDRRDQVDNFGGAAVGMPFWITEFGWGTQRWSTQSSGNPANLYTGPPQGAPRPPINAAEELQEDHLTQAFTNWATHCELLKLRAASWYWLRDFTNAKTGSPPKRNPAKLGTFQFCGLRTDESDPTLDPPIGHNPAPWRWKNVAVGDDPQNPTTGIKAALDSFGAGVSIGAVTGPPDAVTMQTDLIDEDSARLRGTADPNNLVTDVYHEWSEDPLPPPP